MSEPGFRARAEGKARQVNIGGDHTGDINLPTVVYHGLRPIALVVAMALAVSAIAGGAWFALSDMRSDETHEDVRASVSDQPSKTGWFPDRQTHTESHLPEYPVLNSVIDNPDYGDERNFMRIRDTTSGGRWTDSIELSRGHEYEVAVFFRNDGTRSTDFAYARADFPQDLLQSSDDTNYRMYGYVGASNAQPSRVQDYVELKNRTGGTMGMRLESDSVRLQTSGKADGVLLDVDDFFGPDFHVRPDYRKVADLGTIGQNAVLAYRAAFADAHTTRDYAFADPAAFTDLTALPQHHMP